MDVRNEKEHVVQASTSGYKPKLFISTRVVDSHDTRDASKILLDDDFLATCQEGNSHTPFTNQSVSAAVSARPSSVQTRQ